MEIENSWSHHNVLRYKRKKKGQKKGPAGKEGPSYKELELRQGKADAEMLLEKKD